MGTLLVGDSGELRTGDERWELKGLLLKFANLGRCRLRPDSVGRERARIAAVRRGRIWMSRVSSRSVQFRSVVLLALREVEF